MDHRSRSWRRAQRDRTLARVQAWLKTHSYITPDLPAEDLQARVVRRAAAPHTCSGPCCGNPRTWFGERTVQELRADAWVNDEN